MTDADQYEYEDQNFDGVICPRCNGDGTVICHCGGDLCVCDNYGDAPCPVCHEEGAVSEERAAKYEKSQAEAFAIMQRCWKEQSND